MKKYVLLMFLAACGVQRIHVITGLDGKDGKDGLNGANGYSLASEYTQASELECSNSGTRLDIYLDLDYSFNVSTGDLYTGSLIACNGLNGLQGIQGLQGVAGANGETGAQGLPGQPGPQGEAGPQGLAGTDGENGSAGAVGPEGPQGVAGPTGAQGIQGATGATGASGSGATITVYSSTSCTLIAGSVYYTKKGTSHSAIYSTSSCSSSSKVQELDSGESFWVGTSLLAVDYDSNGIKVINFN